MIGFRITPSWNGYTPAQTRAICERAETELAAIPGVRSAVGSVVALIGDSNWGTDIRVEGMAPGAGAFHSKFNEVGPDFFSKSGIPLIAGRDVRDTDTATSPKVILVNETFVKQFLGGRYAVGLRAGTGGKGDLNAEIVGVVKDSHYSGVRQTPPAVFYRPWRQDERLGSISFYVRTLLPPQQIVPQIRSVMRSIDRDVPLTDMRTLEEQVHFNIRQDELITRLAAAASPGSRRPFWQCWACTA